MKIVGIIPSRLASSRFPNKPLALIDGKTMLQRVYEQCKKAKQLHEVFIATSDKIIIDHASLFTENIISTSSNHDSGTSRCIEAFEKINLTDKYDGFVNIQGDEPLIDPNIIDDVVLTINDSAIITFVRKNFNTPDFYNTNVVKVVIDNNQNALHFSRNLIPLGATEILQHIGIYGFHKSIVKKIKDLEPSKLELSEKLEQLRWLDNNVAIKVLFTDYISHGVDTPEDIDKILMLLKLLNE